MPGVRMVEFDLAEGSDMVESHGMHFPGRPVDLIRSKTPRMPELQRLTVRRHRGLGVRRVNGE